MQQGTHFGLFLSRVQSNYVLTPEGRVHYYEAEPRIPGGGIPIVLVHGLGDRDEAWAPMLKRLKRAGFHVYAPDLLGYGRSPRPQDGDYSIGGRGQSSSTTSSSRSACRRPTSAAGRWADGSR